MRFVIGASMMLLVACSGAGSQSSNGADDYEGLFAAPKKPLSTPVTIHGLWSGSIDSADLRMKLEPNKVTLGVRCGEATAGVTIAAEVSASSIKTLESGSAKAGACTLQVRPRR